MKRPNMKVTMRAYVMFLLINAFVASIFLELSAESTAAIAGPMGISIGFYFKGRSV